MTEDFQGDLPALGGQRHAAVLLIFEQRRVGSSQALDHAGGRGRCDTHPFGDLIGGRPVLL